MILHYNLNTLMSWKTDWECGTKGRLVRGSHADYLPEPFDKWLMGGMARFEVNVRYLFGHLGGEVRKRGERC